MKSLLFVVAALGTLISAAPALAQSTTAKEIMTCTVPVKEGQPQVTASVVVQSESSADFLIMNVNDKGQAFRLFTQTDKGEIANSIAKGSIGLLLLEETFSQDAGVIRNSGFIVISKQQSGSFDGIMAAKGNIYPLNCALK